ncbi:MAG: hypothetical protein DSZ12_05415 [Sulfurovum sp.]|nr:MAG: hypothetical protein DSZ12_05415 [Sulfurovum sp.]
MLKILLTLFIFLTASVFAENITIDFAKTSLTQWHQYGVWGIDQEKKTNILSLHQQSKGSFNLCYTQKVHFLNGSISVDFRANSGRIDQGGGLMWRVQDNDNYYVARFNPLEDNFRFYIVKDGRRSEIASADIKLSSGWHTMRIEQKSNTFIGYLDGKKYLEAKDNKLTKVGGVGVWTKADALSSFNHLHIITEK